MGLWSHLIFNLFGLLGGGKDSKSQNMNQGKSLDQKKKQILWNIELETISQTAKESEYYGRFRQNRDLIFKDIFFIKQYLNCINSQTYLNPLVHSPRNILMYYILSKIPFDNISIHLVVSEMYECMLLIF